MLQFLNISEAMSIALHTCVVLATEGGHYCSVRELAERLGFSANHTTKIMRQLVRAGIVHTERGPAGGAMLARPAREIMLFDIFNAVGGYTTERACLLRPEICKGGCCVIGRLLATQDQRLRTIIQKMSLAGVVRSLHKNSPSTAKGE